MVVAPIMKRIIECIVNETIDSSTSYDEDSPFERSLCAAWDVCTVQEYALAIKDQQFHRALLKVNKTYIAESQLGPTHAG